MTTTLVLAFALAAQIFNLPNGLQSAICYTESRHDINAIHDNDGGSRSIGVCQLKLSTSRGMGFAGTEQELAQPNVNVYYSAKYLRIQLNAYGGDLRKAIAAYNAGRWRENKQGLTMNRKYVSAVFKAWKDNK